MSYSFYAELFHGENGIYFFYQVSVYVHYNNTSKSLIESANIFFVYRS